MYLLTSGDAGDGSGEGPGVRSIRRSTSDASNVFTDFVRPISSSIRAWITWGQTLAWFLFGDVATVPALEYSYLSGAEGPRVFTRVGFQGGSDIDGTEVLCQLDYGCGAHRLAGRVSECGGLIMPNQKDAPPIDFEALADQMVSQLAGPLRINTPQLGEVEFQTVQSTAAALAFLRLEAAPRGLAFQPHAAVMTIGYCRGLGPSRGGCSAKNFVQPGQYGLTVIASANVVAGQVVVSKHAIVGVAACDALLGAPVEVATEGVFNVAKEFSGLVDRGRRRQVWTPRAW